MGKWDIYEDRVQSARLENFDILRREISSGHEWISTKIDNYHKDTGRDKDVIREKILNDDMFAFFFIKDPKRQNIYELTAEELMRDMLRLDRVVNLPNNVKMFYVDGVLCESRKGKTIKNVDFEIECKGRTFHIFHKYIGVDGGAQDNQYNDVKTCMENCKGNKTGVVFVCDGPYFDKRVRWPELKELEDDNLKCCNIFELEKVINEFC